MNIFKIIKDKLFKPAKSHIWKVEKEENLGSYIDYGTCVADIDTIYRIAVYERCLLTGETRIRERGDLFPVEEKE